MSQKIKISRLRVANDKLNLHRQKRHQAKCHDAAIILQALKVLLIQFEQPLIFCSFYLSRPGRDLHSRIAVLQTAALLLGYQARKRVSGVGPPSRPWQGRIITVIRHPHHSILFLIPLCPSPFLDIFLVFSLQIMLVNILYKLIYRDRFVSYIYFGLENVLIIVYLNHLLSQYINDYSSNFLEYKHMPF